MAKSKPADTADTVEEPGDPNSNARDGVGAGNEGATEGAQLGGGNGGRLPPDPFAAGGTASDRVGPGEKIKTAQDGNADNDRFHSGDPVASGRGAKLGGQVRPETQLDEASGNRFLSKPRTDPGPFIREDGPNMKHPDVLKGQRTIREANEGHGFTNTVRVSTAPDHFTRSGENVAEHEASADLLYGSAASDTYHPEGRENASLTQRAQERALDEREVAPQTV